MWKVLTSYNLLPESTVSANKPLSNCSSQRKIAKVKENLQSLPTHIPRHITKSTSKPTAEDDKQ